MCALGMGGIPVRQYYRGKLCCGYHNREHLVFHGYRYQVIIVHTGAFLANTFEARRVHVPRKIVIVVDLHK